MISSLILSQTSFIIHAGVEAPAVMPTTSAWASRLRSKSDARSMSWTSEQTSRQISAKCLVLELLPSPMTTIVSHCAAN